MHIVGPFLLVGVRRLRVRSQAECRRLGPEPGGDACLNRERVAGQVDVQRVEQQSNKRCCRDDQTRGGTPGSSAGAFPHREGAYLITVNWRYVLCGSPWWQS